MTCNSQWEQACILDDWQKGNSLHKDAHILSISHETASSLAMVFVSSNVKMLCTVAVGAVFHCNYVLTLRFKVQLKLNSIFIYFLPQHTYMFWKSLVLCSPLRKKKIRNHKGEDIFLGFMMAPPSFELIWQNIVMKLEMLFWYSQILHKAKFSVLS